MPPVENEDQQLDIEMKKFDVVYQYMNMSGDVHNGEESIAEKDFNAAGRAVIVGLVSRDPLIKIIRVIEVRQADSEEFLTYFERGSAWVELTEESDLLNLQIHQEPIAVDNRKMKSLAHLEKRTITTKDGTMALQLLIKITGSSALAAEKALLEFKPGESIIAILVPSQSALPKPTLPYKEDVDDSETDDEEEELAGILPKPCSKCQSEDVAIDKTEDDDGVYYRGTCISCGHTGDQATSYREACEKWNAEPFENSTPEQVEEAKAQEPEVTPEDVPVS